MSFLEDGGNVSAMNNFNIIPEANASVTSDYSKRYPTTQ